MEGASDWNWHPRRRGMDSVEAILKAEAEMTVEEEGGRRKSDLSWPGRGSQHTTGPTETGGGGGTQSHGAGQPTTIGHCGTGANGWSRFENKHSPIGEIYSYCRCDDASPGIRKPPDSIVG